MTAKTRAPIERTHWDGCWRDHEHRACAWKRIEQLERELEAVARVAVPEGFAIGTYGVDCFEIQEGNRKLAVTWTRTDADRIVAALARTSQEKPQ